MDPTPASPHRVRRAAVANLGCKVNQAEMEVVERLLRDRGVELVSRHAAADLVVVNTCAVTSMAAQKSRHSVRMARRVNPDARVVVTGCSVAIDPESMVSADPAASFFDNESKERMLAELTSLLDLTEGAALPNLSGVEPAFERDRAFGLERSEPEAVAGPVGDVFEFDADRTRAFIKIQDGCSFHCTYCVIPRARGPERSVPAETVLADVQGALASGRREVVLTGINAGTYCDAEGAATHPSNGGRSLSDLVRRILAETEVERIRLSSIEPQHVTTELLDVWAGSGGRCLPHLHVPLQSGDDTILRRMGRRYDTAFYAELLGRVRRAIPDAALHADLIVGFPGEDEAAWRRTVAFVTDLDLAGIHVFRYSARPGTPAARMVGQVDAQAKKRRADEALVLAAEARRRFAARQIGRDLRVLFERRAADGRWVGHAENHVLVSAVARPGVSAQAATMRGVVGIVRADGVDVAARDRITGRLVSAVSAVSAAPAVPPGPAVQAHRPLA